MSELDVQNWNDVEQYVFSLFSWLHICSELVLFSIEFDHELVELQIWACSQQYDLKQLRILGSMKAHKFTVPSA